MVLPIHRDREVARLAAAGGDLLAFFGLGPPPAGECVLHDNGATSPATTLPSDPAAHPLSPEAIVAGLAPSMTLESAAHALEAWGGGERLIRPRDAACLPVEPRRP